MNHPYLSTLEEEMVALLADRENRGFQKELGMRHLEAENDWQYRAIADGVMKLAQGWNSPLSSYFHDPQVLERMTELLEILLEAGPEGRWWSGRRGSGDANVDRFTLLPMCEVALLVLPRLEKGLADRLLHAIGMGMDYQVDSYARCPERTAGEYPNMDAYFMVLAELSARLLDRSDLHRLSLDYLGYLETCLLPDGGFIYFKGTNECEVYHQVNVMMLARLLELTHSARVMELLRRTLGYYPNVMEPSGAAEHYSDPFWKHYWNQPDPGVLDVLATLFAGEELAGQHRWLAQRLHATGVKSKFAGQALDYWVNEPGEPLPDRVVRYDGSLRGPRGRFGAFSWGATTGEYLDSFVGAMVSHQPGKISALQAAGVELLLAEPVVPGDLHHERHGRCAYISARHAGARQVITPDGAALAVDSPVCTGQMPWEELAGDCGWATRQAWLMTPERLVGLMSLYQEDERESEVRRARIYFRFEGLGREQCGRVFRCGELSLRVIGHDFDRLEMADAYRFFLDREPASSEVRFTSDLTPGRKHYQVLVEIAPSGVAPAEVMPLGGGGFGFTVREGGRSLQVVARAGMQPAIIPEGEMPKGWYEGRRIGCLQDPSTRPLPAELPLGALYLIES